MSDIFTKIKRSEIMSKIRSKGNKDTELLMVKVFKEFKISGWLRNQTLLGKPDFVFRKNKIAIFIDGCFWHGCQIHSTIPKSNRKFWVKKLNVNKIRDKFVTKELKIKGWIIIRIWEHELKYHKKVADKIKKQLETKDGFVKIR